MKLKINPELRDVDAVVKAFADASVDFDAEIFNEYLGAYPQYSERLKRYAQIWLMSNRASVVEIGSQDISVEEMLAAQSRMLSQWHKNSSTAQTTDEREALKRLHEISGPDGLRKLTRALLDSDDNEEDVLVMEYLHPGLTGEPGWISQRFAHHLNCSPQIVPRVLHAYQAQQQSRFSSKGKPVVTNPRSWREAVAELSVTDERKKQLLAER